MKSVGPWILGSILAFLVTSGAFLILANLGADPSEVRLEQRQPLPESGSALELSLDDEQLESFEAAPGQTMTVEVRNGGGESLADVTINVEASSENTANTESQRRRTSIEALGPGESAEVAFDLDLSEPETPENYPGPDTPRKIVEIRATTPDGAATIRSVILRP